MVDDKQTKSNLIHDIRAGVVDVNNQEVFFSVLIIPFFDIFFNHFYITFMLQINYKIT